MLPHMIALLTIGWRRSQILVLVSCSMPDTHSQPSLARSNANTAHCSHEQSAEGAIALGLHGEGPWPDTMPLSSTTEKAGEQKPKADLIAGGDYVSIIGVPGGCKGVVKVALQVHDW